MTTSPENLNPVPQASPLAEHRSTEHQIHAREILTPGSYSEHLRIGDILRKETTGGIALIVAAVIAIILANSPLADKYFAVRDFVIGIPIPGLHLELSVGSWAADGLLAVFFFLVGLELKKEFVAGDLRDPQRALVPVVAAFGGVAVPAIIFAAINAGSSETLGGWAIPTATDIAFAVAVLALIGSHLPSPLRLFLLTLAVVDDLIAICIIAIFYTDEIHLTALALFFIPTMIYAILVQKFPGFFATHRWAPWLILLPLGIIAWAFLHEAGIHATIAGVVLGFTVPVRKKTSAPTPEGVADDAGLATVFEHSYRPLSSGVAVPIFAFFSAGVALGGWSGFTSSLVSPVALGVILGLVFGKPIGISLSTFLLTKFTRASLDDAVKWIDLIGVGFLAGIGFTVSLLVGELSFGLGSEFNDEAKVGIIAASVVAAAASSLIILPRNKMYKTISEAETQDSDSDGIPDAFDRD
ncbi:MAG: Na+/H+ antiporter NhaA [Actinomycetaceae bacterium]|nr:Na+/H+ antiporter NhaA [Arcanobacterium sp.]MDD7505479.1 Na+/H+ antiporter NhaA [Actinomycetaceae bacterium]MDY6143165.1 Na+/H+ antiporter NhaA [Arcanobacterium sp.]